MRLKRPQNQLLAQIAALRVVPLIARRTTIGSEDNVRLSIDGSNSVADLDELDSRAAKVGSSHCFMPHGHSSRSRHPATPWHHQRRNIYHA
ncbi:hypothetical protein BDW69DRAFT_17184 [Aspergillus filifer]